jgi:hypothetical protein
LHKAYVSISALLAAQSSQSAELVAHGLLRFNMNVIFSHHFVITGLSVGRHIADTLFDVASKFLLPPSLTGSEMQAWKSLFNGIGHGSGLILAFVFQQTARAIAAASTGADLIVTSTQNILTENKLYTLTTSPYPVLPALHVALIGLGISRVFSRPGIIETVLLSPILTVEFFLRGKYAK